MSKQQLFQHQTPYARIRPETKSPYTRIYLIRHCHPDYVAMQESGDFYMPLSKIGKKQRMLLTEKKLLALDLKTIYSSQLTRSLETAELLAKKLGKRIIVDKRLNEIDWQDWYKVKYFNMSQKTRVKRVAHYQRMDRQLDKFQTEARRLLAEIWHKNKSKGVAIFCHGNLIRIILTSILNADVIGFLSMEIYQSSVSKLVIDKDGYIKINYINSIGHLPRKPNEDLFSFALSQ